MTRAFKAAGWAPPRHFVPFVLPAAPLDLEIGCGVGWHPITYALAHPERHLVAVEHSRSRYASFVRRLQQHRLRGQPLSNLTPVHAHAEAWTVHALPPESLERIFLLYPNPYPKQGDRRRRWYASPFMGYLLSRLKPGGTLCLATNDAFYFNEACQALVADWGLRLVEAKTWSQVTEPDFRPRTHFEKKYFEAGQVGRQATFCGPGRQGLFNAVGSKK